MIVLFEESGAITGIIETTTPIETYAELTSTPKEQIIETDDLAVDFTTHYVGNRRLQQKRAFDFRVGSPVKGIIADGESQGVVNNIPNGTTVTYPDNSTEIVRDGAVEFASYQPGTYTLEFSHPEYLTEEINFEVCSQS